MTFGEKVRHLRLQRGLTRDELARLTGLTGGAVSMYETGARKTPLPVAKMALARALHVKPDDLDDDKEENATNE